MSDPTRDHPRDLLSAYLDDELGVEERAAVDRHLADCESCRDDLASLRRLSGALADEDAPPVPDDLAARIGARIDASKVRPFRRRIAVPVTIAATLAAVALVVVYQWTEPGSIREAPRRFERDQLTKSTSAPSPPTSPPASEPAEPTGSPAVARQDRPAPAPAPQATPAPAPAPASAAQADRKAEVAGAAESKEKIGSLGYAGAPQGIVGGVAGSESHEDTARAKDEAVAAPPPAARAVGEASIAAAKTAFALNRVASPCGDRWVDSGAVGTWVVGDMQVALRELERIAARFEGRGTPEPALRGEPYEIVVPRARYTELADLLRSKGVGGIPAGAALPAGDACVRQRISIQVVLGTPPG